MTRADGTKQLTSRAGRSTATSATRSAGKWKGQNVNGKWFVIKPDGAKNLTCLPAISKPVAPPKASSGDYSY